MSEQPSTNPAGAGQLRTLAVRISEDLRAQLDVLAQLTGRSATEEIRLALEHWIEKTKADPEILKKATKVRAEIAREAETKAKAIAAIFGGDEPTKKGTPSATDTDAARPGARQKGKVGE